MKIICIVLLCFAPLAFSQDESFYRDLFNGNLYSQSKDAMIYKIEVESPKYMIDLNSDGVMDSFQTVKRDGVDFIRINDTYGKSVFMDKLLTKGKNSSIFKAKLVKVNSKTNVLILFYYDGEIKTSRYEASARLYFVTFVNNELKKASLYKGPYFFHEKEKASGKYWNRRYSVNVMDYNKDSQNEISISYNNSSKVYEYIGEGLWAAL